MQAQMRADFLSIDDYLTAEAASEVRHEYINGTLYAMAGASREHNLIALNVASALRQHLRGQPCQVFMADFKIRLRIAGQDIFYYPDVAVGCDPRDQDRYYLRFPKILVEVLSESTERLDRREKWWSYQTIETLEEYFVVAQDRIELTLFRRGNNWQPEVFDRREQAVELSSIGLALPLATVYEGVRV